MWSLASRKSPMLSQRSACASALHATLAARRVHPRREFFQVTEAEARTLLSFFAPAPDATGTVGAVEAAGAARMAGAPSSQSRWVAAPAPQACHTGGGAPYGINGPARPRSAGSALHRHVPNMKLQLRAWVDEKLHAACRCMLRILAPSSSSYTRSTCVLELTKRLSARPILRQCCAGFIRESARTRTHRAHRFSISSDRSRASAVLPQRTKVYPRTPRERNGAHDLSTPYARASALDALDDLRPCALAQCARATGLTQPRCARVQHSDEITKNDQSESRASGRWVVRKLRSLRAAHCARSAARAVGRPKAQGGSLPRPRRGPPRPRQGAPKAQEGPRGPRRPKMGPE